MAKTNAFDKLKTVCRQVANTRPRGSQARAVEKLLAQINQWRHDGPQMTKFVTDPHGAQSLALLGAHDLATENMKDLLFILESDDRSQITMTGEELDSLCIQWLKLRRKNGQRIL